MLGSALRDGPYLPGAEKGGGADPQGLGPHVALLLDELAHVHVTGRVGAGLVRARSPRLGWDARPLRDHPRALVI